MKTPREILLKHHQAAEPRLDPIRREAIRVAADVNRRSLPVRELTFAAAVIRPLTLLWRELVLPARVAWVGIAAAWVVIGVLNLTPGEKVRTATRATAVTRQELRAAWERHRELMHELALLPTTEPAEPPKPNPQPRSDRRSALACA
jgi:hypothetical protein